MTKAETKAETKTEPAVSLDLMGMFTDFIVNDLEKYQAQIRERALTRIEAELGEKATKKEKDEKLPAFIREETKVVFCKAIYTNLTGPQFGSARYWMDKFVDFGVNVASLAFVAGAAVYIAKSAAKSEETSEDATTENPFADSKVSPFKAEERPQRRANH